jgi:ribonucleoside-diphosphate reductase alpha chain
MEEQTPGNETMQQAKTKATFKLPVKRSQGATLKERLTDNAYERILPARYLLKDEDGEVNETPEELFERVAKNVAQPDKEYDSISFEESWKEFYNIMTTQAFMPNSPTLMNAGADLQQLSACFVVHPEDDMDSIFSQVKNAAKIFQSGGGMGYPFHLLRPKGDRVHSTGGIASGPLSFQRVFDTTCGTIKQGGKRRGAQMGIMRVDHPDILRFITAKRNEGELSNFNISVGLTDDFMDAVKADETYTIINPRTNEAFEVSENTAQFYNRDEDWYPQAAGSDQGKDDNFWRDHAASFGDEIDDYDIDLEPGESMELPARFIWETLIDGAWRNGEPGLFMYDETNDMHSFDVDEHPEHRIEATNPCGEQPLENYEACNLGHINLSLLVEDQDDGIGLNFYEWKTQHSDDYDFNTEEGLEAAMQDYIDDALDTDRFERVAKTGMRFLDNVVTMSDFPLEEIEDTVSSLRKVGLGLMGFAQMLIQLGIRYGSDESIAAAKEIQRRITRYSIEASHDLAEERGVFSEWKKSKWADPTSHQDWFEQYTGGLNADDYEEGLRLRNHNTTTIAPTGTTSMIANTSGGCEPIFSLAYYKNVAKDIQGEDMLVEFDDYFIKALEANDVDVEAVKEDAEAKMENNEWDGVQSISDDILPSEVKEIFATANQVSPEEHIDIQAAFQTHNHSGISKTCNFPNSATKDDVREAYMRAYDKGVKGMTVYRDGTREVQVMQTNKDNQLTDMDKVDMLAEVIEEFGGAESLLTSNEFEEIVGETTMTLEDTESEQDVEQDHADVADVDTAPRKQPEPGSRDSSTRERPKVIEGTTQEITTPYGDVFITINNDDLGPFEVFAQIGKAGGYTQSFTEALGRMISLSLRNGARPEDVIEQLDDIRSPKIAWDQGSKIHSVPDAIAEAMRRHVDGGQVGQRPLDDFDDDVDEDKDTDTSAIVKGGESPECPDCGGMLVLQEGCQTCPECGWSKC